MVSPLNTHTQCHFNGNDSHVECLGNVYFFYVTMYIWIYQPMFNAYVKPYFVHTLTFCTEMCISEGRYIIVHTIPTVPFNVLISCQIGLRSIYVSEQCTLFFSFQRNLSTFFLITHSCHICLWATCSGENTRRR